MSGYLQTSERSEASIGRTRIAEIEMLIRPHIRRTPLLETDAAEFGLDSFPIALKLEQLQHSGSFKARGAFANLLTRQIPRAGVVAASGGNHGAAVAYAAQKLGVQAKIFVPSISSAAKIQRIRDYGADLVVGGERYADALGASELVSGDVIEKPAGLTVHPGAGTGVETIVHALLFRFKNLSSAGGDARPGIVHRIDKWTSGLLIVAKNDDAHVRLS